MKRRILSLLLCVAMTACLGVNALAAEEIAASGEAGVSQSILSQTQTTFSVTLPTALPVNVDADGIVTTATNTKIVNNSYGPVEVSGIRVESQNGWSLVDFNTDFTKSKVNVKQYGLRLQGNDVPTGSSASTANFPVIAGGGEFSLTYDANIAAQSDAVSETIANVVFTVGWHEVEYQSFVVTADNRVEIGYTGQADENLVIPATFSGTDGTYYKVTSINDNAFLNCTTLATITIPNTVTSIGQYAFAGCTGLTTINIDQPEGYVRYAPWNGNSWSNPSSITVNWSSSVPTDSIFTYAFRFDSSGNVSGVTVTGLKDKTQATLTVPETVEANGIVYTVSAIGSGVFYNCGSLTSVQIGSAVTSISSSAFHSLSCGSGNLTSITVDESNPNYTSVDGVLYNKNCTVLCVVPSGKTGSFTIPDTVTTVQDYAFQVGKLSSITIGKNVKSGMSYYTNYYMMYSLENIFVDASNPYYSDIDGVLYNKVKTSLYKCPEKKSGVISVASIVTSIGTSAFRSCNSVTRIDIHKLSGSLTYQSWDTNWGAVYSTINWLG
ncbi:leucine-rich repeat domain-containing protein [uncultured Oscillibacter sp.]|uniref:leucine-rich repeat domain-containing protein n=1 Tax=uncultured Oscillibacter sp. TaxID=876091 RepID=UPI0025F6D3B6|nr:leucine-rich repeat domain-containing protein [uncultured Oscillibacter sp.]